VTIPVDYEYYSERLRTLATENRQIGMAEGKAEGVVLGQARALLTVLKARGLEVPDDVRERIVACTDVDQIDAWVGKAATATAAADAID